MFVTHKAGSEMAKAIGESVQLVTLRPTHLGFMLDFNAFKDTLIRVLVKTACTAIPLLIVFMTCFLIAIIRNRITNGSWQVRETLEYVLYEPIQQRPKLDKITFPSRMLSQSNFN
jgi:hypothetical protein